ncbi:hypothetical protein ABGV17_04420 [Guyparkeria sp. GHLCS8-2]|uniref:DUF4376 domain-containing protein n=1 Tax=Guyparkeria halopsychrophila TaxID=3139421 RepID=UPI0037C726BE
MDIFHLHPQTGEFVGQGKADPDPLNDGEFLIPANAVPTAPPTAGHNEAAVYSKGQWSLVPDYRGTEYWLADGSHHEISELGIEMPADALDSPPPKQIADLATDKIDTLEQALQAEFDGGMTHTMPDGTADVVQTRSIDEPNLLGLAIEARDLRDAGETGGVLQLRAQSNVVYSLTPQEMIDLTDAAKAFKKQWLTHSWGKKDAVRTALSADDRAGIEAVTW